MSHTFKTLSELTTSILVFIKDHPQEFKNAPVTGAEIEEAFADCQNCRAEVETLKAKLHDKIEEADAASARLVALDTRAQGFSVSAFGKDDKRLETIGIHAITKRIHKPKKEDHKEDQPA